MNFKMFLRDVVSGEDATKIILAINLVAQGYSVSTENYTVEHLILWDLKLYTIAFNDISSIDQGLL